MTYYFVLKFLHVIAATVLLGTGAGIAFFMLAALEQGLSRDERAVIDNVLRDAVPDFRGEAA